MLRQHLEQTWQLPLLLLPILLVLLKLLLLQLLQIPWLFLDQYQCPLLQIPVLNSFHFPFP